MNRRFAITEFPFVFAPETLYLISIAPMAAALAATR
jgi:hypothetical protein